MTRSSAVERTISMFDDEPHRAQEKAPRARGAPKVTWRRAGDFRWMSSNGVVLVRDGERIKVVHLGKVRGEFEGMCDAAAFAEKL